MIKNISNTSAVHHVQNLLSPHTSTSQHTTNSTLAKTDTFIKTQASAVPDNYSPQSQEPINSDDLKYLGIVDFPDGSTVNFPSDSASLATKKAWIESMKKLTPEEQFMAKTEIFVQMQIATSSHDNPDHLLNFSKANKYLSQISSYQDLFNGFSANIKKDLETGALSDKERQARQHMLQINNTILDTFVKNNIR